MRRLLASATTALILLTSTAGIASADTDQPPGMIELQFEGIVSQKAIDKELAVLPFVDALVAGPIVLEFQIAIVQGQLFRRAGRRGDGVLKYLAAATTHPFLIAGQMKIVYVYPQYMTFQAIGTIRPIHMQAVTAIAVVQKQAIHHADIATIKKQKR